MNPEHELCLRILRDHQPGGQTCLQLVLTSRRGGYPRPLRLVTVGEALRALSAANMVQETPRFEEGKLLSPSFQITLKGLEALAVLDAAALQAAEQPLH